MVADLPQRSGPSGIVPGQCITIGNVHFAIERAKFIASGKGRFSPALAGSADLAPRAPRA